MDLAVSKEFKVNFNDARISRVYVTPTGVQVQDDSPNAPSTGVVNQFDLHLEMEAGGGVAGPYELFTIAYDVTTGANEPALDPPPGALNGPGDFGVAPWVTTTDFFFDRVRDHYHPEHRAEPHLLLHRRPGERQSANC